MSDDDWADSHPLPGFDVDPWGSVYYYDRAAEAAEAANRALVRAPDNPYSDATAQSPPKRRASSPPEGREPRQNKHPRVEGGSSDRDRPRREERPTQPPLRRFIDVESDSSGEPRRRHTPPPDLHDNGRPNVWDRIDELTTQLPEDRAFALLRFLEDANDEHWVRLVLGPRTDDALQRTGGGTGNNNQGVWVSRNRAVTININHTTN